MAKILIGMPDNHIRYALVAELLSRGHTISVASNHSNLLKTLNDGLTFNAIITDDERDRFHDRFTEGSPEKPHANDKGKIDIPLDTLATLLDPETPTFFLKRDAKSTDYVSTQLHRVVNASEPASEIIDMVEDTISAKTGECKKSTTIQAGATHHQGAVKGAEAGMQRE